jgi:hypothetical protein
MTHGKDQIEYREVDGVQVVDIKYRTSELGVLVHLFGDAYDVFALDMQVRDGRRVTRPDRVVVQGPPHRWLRVTVHRLSLAQSPEKADVVQHGFQMYEDTALLPEDWFREGDYVQVERTMPFEPRPAVEASRRPAWLGGEPGSGMGDFISRRR